VRALVTGVPSVDILVSNAGPIPSTPFFEAFDDEWQRYQDAYVGAAARLARHYMPRMVETRWGRFLFSAGMTCSYAPGNPEAASRMIAWLPPRRQGGLARPGARARGSRRRHLGDLNTFIPGPAPSPEALERAGVKASFEDFSREYFNGPGLAIGRVAWTWRGLRTSHCSHG
jgi:hypothetical protein